jgi:hypothetical protein
MIQNQKIILIVIALTFLFSIVHSSIIVLQKRVYLNTYQTKI